MSIKEKITLSLLEWYKKNRRYFPWRDEGDPYKILIAEYFLQRTPANRVAKLFPVFINQYPDPYVLLLANPSDLVTNFRSLGLKKRMKWLVDSMHVICNEYDGRIPNCKQALKKLPGIGEYTASAILCFAFKKEIEIVDSNIIRVYSRIFNISKKEISSKAKEMLPETDAFSYNEALLDFSAIICKNQPRCEICPIKKYCSYFYGVSESLSRKSS